MIGPMTTLRDLSRHLNLSVTQVSRALNGYDDVADVTRARVVAAAKAMRYSPNLSARKLVTGRAGMAALVLSGMPHPDEDSHFVQIVGGLSRHLSRLGRQFVLHIADADEDEVDVYRKLVGGGAIDGFVLLNPETRDRRAAFLRRAGIPFVVHGRLDGPADYPFFDIDNQAVGRTLTQILIEAGHRRIGFLNGPRPRTYARARHAGWREALEAAGLAADPALHRFGPMTAGEGLLGAAALLDRRDPPTGLICGNTRLAQGVLAMCAAHGLSVPGDISVVVHEDELPGLRAHAFTPPLTATRSPLADSWEPLALGLSSLLDGGPVAAHQQVIAIGIDRRDSVAAPR